MLVGERMSYPVVSVNPELPINEALTLMRRERIRRTPVIRDGKLVGIISDKDLLNASPSPATSLSIWEMNYLLSKITVRDVMTREVLTVNHDTPIEEAARIMADNKIGGLPVIQDDKVVGIITETDLFKIFLEMMGARETGVRCTVIVRNQPGELAKITHALTGLGGDFVAFGQFLGSDPSNRMVTFKVAGLENEQVRQALEPLVERLVDIRSS
jgi:acetoin utilization protein AcuB